MSTSRPTAAPPCAQPGDLAAFQQPSGCSVQRLWLSSALTT